MEADCPTPLPNLDFRIATGDSLLGPCDRIPSDLFRGDLRKRAESLLQKKERFLTASGKEKGALRQSIEREEGKIAVALKHLVGDGIIDWQIQFAEVFGSRDGFDIVLANPPYVSALEFTRTRTKAERDRLRRRFRTAKGAWDLYVPFFERGLQLLGSCGQLAYVTPNKYLSISYARALRQYIRESSTLLQIVDLTEVPVFQSAAVYPVLTFLRKGREDTRCITCRTPTEGETSGTDPKHFDISNVRQTALDLLPERLWGFLLSNQLDLLNRLLANTVPMTEVANVRGYDYCGGGRWFWCAIGRGRAARNV